MNGNGFNPKQAPRCVCGHWPGRHRWGDNACPNPDWRCGNGQSQWLRQTYRRERRKSP